MLFQLSQSLWQKQGFCERCRRVSPQNEIWANEIWLKPLS
jgi:hypothetical protein